MSKQILQNLFQGHSYGNFKGAAGLKLQFYGNEKTMNLNPLILANIQNSPYFKVGKVYSPSRHGVTFYLFFIRPSCLRCGLFTRLWTRFTTRWTTWSPGRWAPARQPAAAARACVGGWGACPLGGSSHQHSASSTNSTHSNSPRSRWVIGEVLCICNTFYYWLSFSRPRCCVCLTTATPRTSGAWASCSSGSRCHPRWCMTGSRDTLTTKRYVELCVLYLLSGIHQDDSVTVSCYEDHWYTWWVTACHPVMGGTFSFGRYQTIHF